ncbi:MULTISPECIES: hypothetical protein [Bacillaceae]|uniref:hypothetical protein n=1 Tax=Bacillaceae TaxID=186817 RepID=UPI002964CC0C|nr:hypothetical protein [Bacillus infantis]MDW2879544.1 hypothetical protein [Bacillus infantis]
MANRCIYCNTTEVLTVSDIFPESLTNAKITKKNVCRIRHNNEFGSTFEYDVISKLTFLRNHLDITNKESKYGKYDVTVIIDGVEYDRKIKNAMELFNGNIYKSKEGDYLFGDFEKIKKIAERKGKELKQIDINNKEIELKIGFSLEVLFSLSMRRLAAKIAYEWLCSLNDINERYDDFANIINFIETGNDDNFVSYIANNDVYNAFSEVCESGSHSLIAYEDNDNHLQVLINFFGICIFNVNFGKKILKQIQNRFGFTELQVTSKKVEYKSKNFFEFTDRVINNVVFIGNDKMRLAVPLISQQDIQIGFGIINIMSKLKNMIGNISIDNELVQTVLENYKELIHTSVLHIRKLKRFVNEHFSDFTEEKILNPQGNSYDEFFLYYLLYLIGKNGDVPKESNYIYKLVISNIGERGPLILNNTFIEELKVSLFNDEKYPEQILNGAKLVKDAPYH